jgi:hypothetical protein
MFPPGVKSRKSGAGNRKIVRHYGASERNSFEIGVEIAIFNPAPAVVPAGAVTRYQ